MIPLHLRNPEQRKKTLAFNRALKRHEQAEAEHQKTESKAGETESKRKPKRFKLTYTHVRKIEVWEGQDLLKAALKRFGEDRGYLFFYSVLMAVTLGNAGSVWGWSIEELEGEERE